MVLQQHGRLRFGSLRQLPNDQLAALAKALQHDPGRERLPLDGRGGNHRSEIPGLGNVFVKHYLRGGLLSLIVERGHLWNPRSRSRREFEILHDMRAAGLRTPEPLAWAERGGCWIHCWLIMREEPNTVPLTALARENPEQAATLVPQVAPLVARLIHRRFHHVDLHPGNVLVEPDQSLMLIDFDKARTSSMSPDQLTKRYLRRWHRAVAKHKLPKFLSDEFARALAAELERKPAD